MSSNKLPPGFTTDINPVTRSDFEQVCLGFAAMQRQTLNVIAGCAAAIEELRQQVTPDTASVVMPKLHDAIGQLRAITMGQTPPSMQSRQQKRAEERDKKAKFDALHDEKKNAKPQ